MERVWERAKTGGFLAEKAVNAMENAFVVITGGCEVVMAAGS